MKRKETKSNNSKHPVKKLIALWVVFALLIVPFANHVGDKNGTKAEEGSATGIKTGATQTVNVELEAGSAVINPAGEYEAEVTKKIVNYTLLQDEQTLKVKDPEFTFKPISEAYTVPFITKKYYKLVDMNDDTLKDSYTEQEIQDLSLTEYPAEGVVVPTDKKLAIYVCSIETPEDGNEYFRGLAKLAYVVTANYVDSAFTTGAGLYDGSTSLTSDSYVSEATLKAPTTVASIEGATVKYYVKIGSAADESEKKDINSYTFIGDTISTTENNRGKQVYAYAALVSNETPAQVLEYIELGSVHMSNDTQAPNISCEALDVFYWDEETSNYVTIQDKFIDENSVYYGVSDKYKYAVTVEDPTKDGEDTSGIKNVTATLMVHL